FERGIGVIMKYTSNPIRFERAASSAASLLCSLSLFGCVAPAGGDTLAPGEDVGSAQDHLYGGGTISSLWSGPIPVCSSQSDSGLADQRRRTRELILDTWARVAPLKFTGWKTCSSSNPPNTIRVTFQDDTNGLTDKLGPSPSKSTNVTLIANVSNQVFH